MRENRLTRIDYDRIIKLHADGSSHSVLAALYSINRSHVSRIINGKCKPIEEVDGWATSENRRCYDNNMQELVKLLTENPMGARKLARHLGISTNSAVLKLRKLRKMGLIPVETSKSN